MYDVSQLKMCICLFKCAFFDNRNNNNKPFYYYHTSKNPYCLTVERFVNCKAIPLAHWTK